MSTKKINTRKLIQFYFKLSELKKESIDLVEVEKLENNNNVYLTAKIYVLKEKLTKKDIRKLIKKYLINFSKCGFKLIDSFNVIYEIMNENYLYKKDYPTDIVRVNLNVKEKLEENRIERKSIKISHGIITSSEYVDNVTTSDFRIFVECEEKIKYEDCICKNLTNEKFLLKKIELLEQKATELEKKLEIN